MRVMEEEGEKSRLDEEEGETPEIFGPFCLFYLF